VTVWKSTAILTTVFAALEAEEGRATVSEYPTTAQGKSGLVFLVLLPLRFCLNFGRVHKGDEFGLLVADAVAVAGHLLLRLEFRLLLRCHYCCN